MDGLAATRVGLSFGGIRVLHDLTLEVPAERVTALIGPNGAGKTSFFNCVSGLYRPSAGSLTFDGHDLVRRKPHRVAGIGIARTFQNVALFPRLTVLENVLCGGHLQSRAGMIASALRFPPAVRDERRLVRDAMDALTRLGLQDLADHQPGDLPLGTMKRIEIARALVAKPRLLMLDEPANGLDGTEVEEMAQLIRDLQADLRIAILLVEHHMGMVMKISDDVIVLDQGRVIAQGDPLVVAKNPTVVEAYLGGTS
ncbi:ABC transporter ATP-binding protein [Microtetraspora malaysiensis]|uniref:ABC transporter ATP-binding protein n=1 Tax=Microtetraspora malaysiensis TaxID=161358 RepID=UPI003D89E475